MQRHTFPVDRDTLLFSTVMLHKALEAALEALAEMHEHESDAWLDHLEAQALLRGLGLATVELADAHETHDAPAEARAGACSSILKAWFSRRTTAVGR
jgi:hypothetical protein